MGLWGYFSFFTRKALETKTPPRDASSLTIRTIINQSIKTQACPILNRDSDKLDSQGKYNFPEVCLPQRSVYQKQMPKVSLGTSSGEKLADRAQESVSRIHHDGVLQDPIRGEESED